VSEPPDRLIHAVLEAAQRAGDAALLHYRRPIAVARKPDGSPVTVADREAEIAARRWIERRFPADGIEGEEFGLTRPEAPRRWLIDPIDGTTSFVRGVPLWGSLVAVAEGETVLAGAAVFPALDERIAAARGAGCFWNDAPCRVSEVDSLAAAVVLATDDRFPAHPERRELWMREAGTAAVSRTWGDCFGYLLVATGRAEVMVDDRVNAWDVAPFLPIVEEAGGVLTDWRGAVTARGGDAIATNRVLAAEARALLRVGTRE
jgi:histidinol phosphatase-like enzyme (inositol monophosphatase family)